MAKQEYTAYQQGIISNYYNQLDTIMLTKLQELVSELYLADTDAKKKRLWDRVQKAMVKLKDPADDRRAHHGQAGPPGPRQERPGMVRPEHEEKVAGQGPETRNPKFETISKLKTQMTETSVPRECDSVSVIEH